MLNRKTLTLLLCFIMVFCVIGCDSDTSLDISEFDNKPYVSVNNNEPFFSNTDKQQTEAFEHYSALDSLGRCGVAYANICKQIMPTQERGEIGSVKPSGWQSVKYDTVDGSYLYNRCHLIGYQLAGENANEKNLITGTRYLNIEGMLPFENMVHDYVTETNNHVLYRGTPIFEDNNLVASGVLMEGYSVEDEGEGISFCVYCYNSQPGINIDYSNGFSSVSSSDITSIESSPDVNNDSSQNAANTYILNTNSLKFHRPECNSTNKISNGNKEIYTGSRDDLIKQGYEPCKNCNP